MSVLDEPYATLPFDMQEFKRKQLHALRSLDVQVFRDYMSKYNPEMSEMIARMPELQVQRSMHLARLQADFMTPEEKEVSGEWLKEHGFRGWEGVL